MDITKEALKGASELAGRGPGAREKPSGATETTRNSEEAGRTSKAVCRAVECAVVLKATESIDLKI